MSSHRGDDLQDLIGIRERVETERERFQAIESFRSVEEARDVGGEFSSTSCVTGFSGLPRRCRRRGRRLPSVVSTVTRAAWRNAGPLVSISASSTRP